MAVGANDEYWKNNRLPGVLKHGIVRRYLPIYLARTSFKTGKVVYLDGYAGRGFYDDGQPGSAGLILQAALDRVAKGQPPYMLRFFEWDDDNFPPLAGAVAKFAAQGVDVKASQEGVSD